MIDIDDVKCLGKENDGACLVFAFLEEDASFTLARGILNHTKETQKNCTIKTYKRMKIY